MPKTKRTPASYAALLLAVLLLTMLSGCTVGNDLPPPSSPSGFVGLAASDGTEESPAPAPMPEIPQPTLPPEPEISESDSPPEPEVSESPSSPEPENTEAPPLPNPDPPVPPEPEVSEPVPPAETMAPEPDEEPPPAAPPLQEEPESDSLGITSPRAGLYELETLSPVYEKNSGQTMAPGSMSKIVTAITALHYISPDTVFTVGTELQLVQPDASICLIAPGHQLTLAQLLMGMLLPSGCDAAYTIAVNTGRLVAENLEMSDAEAADYFCGLMNHLAAELGAPDSHFANPDGWDHGEHYTTVRDMALLAAHAMEYEVLREIVSTPEQRVFFVSGENITWHNTNALLHEDSPYYLPGAVGMKTGTTTAAGNCLLSVLEKDGAYYIAVVAGNATTTGRYEDTLKLFELIP